MNTMRALLLVAAVGIAGYAVIAPDEGPPSSPPVVTNARGDDIRRAFDNQLSDVQVTGAGVVTRVLADDTDGSRHQRFILRLADGQTVLISHNIDLAPRIPDLRSGDRVEFSGKYEWNAKGGVIHWTHHDPAVRDRGGWLRRGGDTFR